ncbi:MAG: hypothetical protein PVG30_00660 [Gammaproteobacteria bacterium]
MKSTIAWFSIVLLFLSLVGCSTSYGPCGLTGGYSDMRLNNDTYKVAFRGNGFTSQDKVQNLLLRRCAELTKQNNYRYFVILTGKENHSDSQYATPTRVNTYGYGNFSGYGNANTNYYGNSAYTNTSFNGNQYSNSYSTVTPGQVYNIRKYADAVIMKMLRNRKKYANAFDANMILQELGSKRTG